MTNLSSSSKSSYATEVKHDFLHHACYLANSTDFKQPSLYSSFLSGYPIETHADRNKRIYQKNRNMYVTVTSRRFNKKKNRRASFYNLFDNYPSKKKKKDIDI